MILEKWKSDNIAIGFSVVCIKRSGNISMWEIKCPLCKSAYYAVWNADKHFFSVEYPTAKKEYERLVDE